MSSKFLNIYNPTGAEPVPSKFKYNPQFKIRFKADSLLCYLDSAAIYVSQNGTYLPGFNENATLSFTPGKTYRLRIINAGSFAMFQVWIDGHQMRVIEADGVSLSFSFSLYLSWWKEIEEY